MSEYNIHQHQMEIARKFKDMPDHCSKCSVLESRLAVATEALQKISITIAENGQWIRTHPGQRPTIFAVQDIAQQALSALENKKEK